MQGVQGVQADRMCRVRRVCKVCKVCRVRRAQEMTQQSPGQLPHSRLHGSVLRAHANPRLGMRTPRLHFVQHCVDSTPPSPHCAALQTNYTAMCIHCVMWTVCHTSHMQHV